MKLTRYNHCEASQRNYNSYSSFGPLRPALEADTSGRVPCPVCGKRVKLRLGALKRWATVIPTHTPATS